MDEWRAKAAVIPIITTVVSIFCGYAASVREEYLKYSQMMMLWYRWSAHTHKIHWQSHMARRQGRREVEVWRLLHACAFGLHSARWYHLLPRVVSGAHVCCVDHWPAGRVRASKLVEFSLALSFVRADVNWRIRREQGTWAEESRREHSREWWVNNSAAHWRRFSAKLSNKRNWSNNNNKNKYPAAPKSCLNCRRFYCIFSRLSCHSNIALAPHIIFPCLPFWQIRRESSSSFSSPSISRIPLYSSFCLHFT